MTYEPNHLPPTRRFDVPAPPMSPAPYGYVQPYGFAPPPMPMVIVAQAPPTSGLATASMVLGIIGALGGWCMLGIPCLIAIVLGHGGIAATRGGVRGGRGMAVAGLVLGYVFVVPWAILFFTTFLGAIIGSGPTPAHS
jgi:hypothetical protein